ncbi:Rv3654c family TadE-like protein [Protaetiibacter intestinalis]|uniref:Rv3654c family TadE-like protein n=1 Tax=Protaetiibacter intestinalis TaxID=2419774 RepID=UPI0013004843|nr:Rv3654c family TadE-like protein [Protaetiibacter intestinalis]
MRARDDRGSGGVLALALVGATLVVALTVLGLGAALAARQRAVAAADAAALAAADALLGVAPGEPCALAEEVATAHRVALSVCTIDGAEALVAVRTEALGVTMELVSRAGPPP